MNVQQSFLREERGIDAEIENKWVSTFRSHSVCRCSVAEQNCTEEFD